MSNTPSVSSDTSTSEERWRRWEQRGVDNDARFMRRVRRFLWSALAVIVGGGASLWLWR